MMVLEGAQKIASLIAFEFFCQKAMSFVTENSNLECPLSKINDFYGLLEYESTVENDNAISECFKKFCREKIVETQLISRNAIEADYFWRFRKKISLSLSQRFPYKFDIGVLPSKIASFMSAVDELFKSHYPNFETVIFGHVGDGNVHFNVLKPDALAYEDFLVMSLEIANRAYLLVSKFQGTVSSAQKIGVPPILRLV